MASLAKAKDVIKTLPKEVQLRATKEVAQELTEREGRSREDQINDAKAQILADTPELTVEDGNQLVAWQEARETGRSAGP